MNSDSTQIINELQNQASFWQTVGINIFSNLLFTGILVLLGYCFYFISDRRKLQKFFGIQSSYKKINVYLPLIRTWDGIAMDLNNGQAMFDSYAVSLGEMESALAIRDIFNFIIPNLTDKPGGPGILDKLLLSDIDVKIDVSVLYDKDIPAVGSIVSIGGTTYNRVSRYIQNSNDSHVKISGGIDDGIEISQMQSNHDPLNGFIQRTRGNDGRYFFYVAGLSTYGTVMAVNYLASNWKSLHKQYSDKNFVVLVKFPNPSVGGSPSIIHQNDW